MVDYLESYAARFDIRPVFNTTVSRIRRDGAQWRAERPRARSAAPVVVVATGIADAPYRPAWPGSERYRGAVIHSSEYRNPGAFAGKRVLVVGFGNSGGEIALDLANAGVDVAMCGARPGSDPAARSAGLSDPVMGDPVPAACRRGLSISSTRRSCGSRVGSIRETRIAARGQGAAPDGRGGRPRAADRYRHAGQDQGRLHQVRGGIDRFTPDGVVFADATREKFDAVILATGFRPDLRAIGSRCGRRVRRHGMPLVTGQATAAPGLYFCGQITSPTGQLREIGLEARRIAGNLQTLHRGTWRPAQSRRERRPQK